MKATVENPRGSVVKLSPKGSVEGGNTVLRGSVRAPEGFYEGKPKAAKTRGRSLFSYLGRCLQNIPDTCGLFNTAKSKTLFFLNI